MRGRGREGDHLLLVTELQVGVGFGMEGRRHACVGKVRTASTLQTRRRHNCKNSKWIQRQFHERTHTHTLHTSTFRNYFHCSIFFHMASNHLIHFHIPSCPSYSGMTPASHPSHPSYPSHPPPPPPSHPPFAKYIAKSANTDHMLLFKIKC